MYVIAKSAMTTITSQNSKNFAKLYNIPNNILRAQLKASFEEYKIDGVKIGLVNNISTAKVIYDFLKNFKKKRIVIDPILKSTNGKMICDLIQYQKNS